MVELIAGLLVAALLVGGLVDVIRRYARTTDHIRTVAADLRDIQIANALLEEIARVDPGSLSVTPRRIHGQIGSNSFEAELVPHNDRTVLRWSSLRIKRDVGLPASLQFERLPFGAIGIVASEAHQPIAFATPRRTLPFDCQFDTVSRECRQ